MLFIPKNVNLVKYPLRVTNILPKMVSENILGGITMSWLSHIFYLLFGE